VETEHKWFRIADLERLSGISRHTIHFYMRDGLLHPPLKTGKTMAYYDEAHLRKLSHIREARSQGKPLIAIRKELAVLDTKREGPLEERLAEAFHSGGEFHVRQSLPQREKGKKTREAIIEIGCRLFREKGYNSARINDITRELNIGKGTFYFHFNHKKELFLECIPRIFHDLFAEGWARARQFDDPQKRLELRAQMGLSALRDFCAVLKLTKEALDDPDPHVRTLGEQIFVSIRRPIENDYARGIEQGLFHDVDPKIAATAAIGIMESVYYLQQVDKRPVSRATLEGVLSLIFSGAKTRDARQASSGSTGRTPKAERKEE
jgi:AcrR family transcriptional regulator